jgi:hypothetical protein
MVEICEHKIDVQRIKVKENLMIVLQSLNIYTKNFKLTHDFQKI